MKRILQTALFSSFVVIALCSFIVKQDSGIKGTVAPADGAGIVWAVSGTDSLKVTPDNGAFSISVKPGTYKVIVQALADYKTFIKDNVVVEEGKVTDLGTITLEK